MIAVQTLELKQVFSDEVLRHTDDTGFEDFMLCSLVLDGWQLVDDVLGDSYLRISEIKRSS